MKMIKFKNNKNKLAFTITETLLYLSLLSLLILIALTSVSLSIKTNKSINFFSYKRSKIINTISNMEKDISMIYTQQHFCTHKKNYKIYFKGNNKNLSFLSFNNNHKHMTIKKCDQKEISFFLINNKKNTCNTLIKRKKAILNKKFQHGGFLEIICPFVNDIQISYFNQQKNKWQNKWKKKQLNKKHNSLKKIYIKLFIKMKNNTTESTSLKISMNL